MAKNQGKDPTQGELGKFFEILSRHWIHKNYEYFGNYRFAK